METNGKVGAMIFAFILLVVGITFATTIGNSTSQAVTTQKNSNVTCDMSAAVTPAVLGWEGTPISCVMSDADIFSYDSIKWDNNVTNMVAADYTLTLPTDVESKTIVVVIANSTGNIASMASTNKTVITYSYYPDGYVKNSTGRTLFSSFLVLFFVLAILGTVLGILLKSGVINFNF